MPHVQPTRTRRDQCTHARVGTSDGLGWPWSSPRSSTANGAASRRRHERNRSVGNEDRGDGPEHPASGHVDRSRKDPARHDEHSDEAKCRARSERERLEYAIPHSRRRGDECGRDGRRDDRAP